jgi:WD40 repeat protein
MIHDQPSGRKSFFTRLKRNDVSEKAAALVGIDDGCSAGARISGHRHVRRGRLAPCRGCHPVVEKTARSYGQIPNAAHRAKIQSLAFSPDGRTIATGDILGTIAFSHLETGRLLFDTKVASDKINHLSFSPNGGTLAIACYRKQVILLHAPGLTTFDQEDYGPAR